MKVMYTVDELSKKIKEKKSLFLAGDEKVLSKLPKGRWIGGTIPYFMAENGGEFSQDKIYATELPAYISDLKIKAYTSKTIPNVYKDLPDNGFGLIVIPATSKTHLEFALKSPSYEGFGTSPLIGWIAGINLADLGKISPKVLNGETLEVLEDGALVLQAKLPENKAADINIINIFQQGQGDALSFKEDGFSVKTVLVNGKETNFADYILENGLDTRLPLVADYYGALVNISFQNVDKDKKEVQFYAPVFKGMMYKLAAPVKDYIQLFSSQLPKEGADHITFSCNCILNYLYSELEGKKTGAVTGPITFGEIAYQLLNQTMVYLTIDEI